MDDQPLTHQQNAPTSWRDVYQLVQDSERRLTATITDGFQRQAAVSQDHEVRLRMTESHIQNFNNLVQTGTRQQEEIMRDWGGWRTEITSDVAAIKQSDLVQEARKGGILAVGNKAKAIFLVLAGLVGPAVTTVLLRLVFPPS